MIQRQPGALPAVVLVAAVFALAPAAAVALPALAALPGGGAQQLDAGSKSYRGAGGAGGAQPGAPQTPDRTGSPEGQRTSGTSGGKGNAGKSEGGGTAGDDQGDDQSDPEDEIDLEINHAVLDFTVVNLPTTLRLPRYKSAFRVTHRFTRPLGDGSFGDLAADLFGFDSSALIGLEYRFAVVRGGELRFYRTSDRTIQLSGKYNFVRQDEELPLAASAFAGVEGANNFRRNYTPFVGVVVSRQFEDRAAAFVHAIFAANTNPLPEELAEDEHTLLVGVGARLRLLPTVYLVGETTIRAAGHRPGTTPVSFGVEKNVGGHVFQINFSNSLGSMFGQLARGGAEPRQWHLGFNISRKFY